MKTINIYTNSTDIKGPLSHDYDILTDGFSITEMHRSENSSWTNPGEKIITCSENIATGDHKINVNGKKIKLNTAEAYELFILLGILFKKDRIEYRESTVIKSI